MKAFTWRLKHVLWKAWSFLTLSQYFQVHYTISEPELKSNINPLCFKSLVNKKVDLCGLAPPLPPYAPVLRSALRQSTLLYSSLLESFILFSTLLYPIYPAQCTLHYSTLIYFTLLCYPLLYSTLIYVTQGYRYYVALLYNSLLY